MGFEHSLSFNKISIKPENKIIKEDRENQGAIIISKYQALFIIFFVK